MRAPLARTAYSPAKALETAQTRHRTAERIGTNYFDAFRASTVHKKFETADLLSWRYSLFGMPFHIQPLREFWVCPSLREPRERRMELAYNILWSWEPIVRAVFRR